MDGIRHRKGVADNMGSLSNSPLTPRTFHSPIRLLKMIVYLTVIILGILLVLVMLNSTWPLKSTGHSTNALDKLSIVLGVQEQVHAIVIDAGSTGSRVLAFTFFRSSGNPLNSLKKVKGPLTFISNNSSYEDNSLKLYDELWHEQKPGLSSYADNPEAGAASLFPLLEKAKNYIPNEKWSSTPLVLKATAGLRLLPEEKANALLKEVMSVLNSSGFQISENSVGIMDGRDEGIFSWFTVNYLLDKVAGHPKDTLVALDLGGGSTQITFVPVDTETIIGSPKEHLSSISLLRKSLKLYTHSYLGLGLMAGRTAVLSNHLNEDSMEVHSPCINPIITAQWDYQGASYTVKGSSESKYLEIKGKAGRLSEKRPIADFAECFKTCVDVITSKVQNVPRELKNRGVIAFSYFFDRATERGLIDPFTGGVVTVQRLLHEAEETCKIPNSEQPFACLDLTFISAFLNKGYKLEPSTEIMLYKKINGYEVSWALGLAFHIINNGI